MIFINLYLIGRVKLHEFHKKIAIRPKNQVFFYSSLFSFLKQNNKVLDELGRIKVAEDYCYSSDRFAFLRFVCSLM